MDRITKRKIEAEALIPLIERLEQQMSFAEINNMLIQINKKEAFERGNMISPSGKEDTISKLSEDVNTWGDGGLIEIESIEKTKNTLHFNVTRCPYFELYKKLGIERYGVAFSCCRDEPFARGFNQKLKLIRSKTIMEGDDYCDFRYFLEA